MRTISFEDAGRSFQKENEYLYFNAGNHEECIRISTEDFLRVVKGVVGSFSVEGKKIREKEKAAV